MAPSGLIERGVWADAFDTSVEGAYRFYNVFEDAFNETVGVYPLASTFITSIQTLEEYNSSKANRANSLKDMD
jgi:hypothetical protein